MTTRQCLCLPACLMPTLPISLPTLRTDWKTIQDAQKNKPQVAADTGPSDLEIYALIGVILLAVIIILVLNRVIGTLEKLLVKNKEIFAVEPEVEEAPVDRLAILKKYAKNKKLCIFCTRSWYAGPWAAGPG